MDWSDCPDVERKPDVMSGAPVIVGTRIPPETVLEHLQDGFTLEEITTELFPSIALACARRIVEYARTHEPA